MKLDLAKAADPRAALPAPRDVAARTPERAPAPAPAQPSQVAVRQAAAQEAAQQAAAEANRKLSEKGSELTIEFDDALGRMIFRLVNTQTREVVRQIPSEQVIAVARALTEFPSAGALLRADA